MASTAALMTMAEQKEGSCDEENSASDQQAVGAIIRKKRPSSKFPLAFFRTTKAARQTNGSRYKKGFSNATGFTFISRTRGQMLGALEVVHTLLTGLVVALIFFERTMTACRVLLIASFGIQLCTLHGNFKHRTSHHHRDGPSEFTTESRAALPLDGFSERSRAGNGAVAGGPGACGARGGARLPRGGAAGGGGGGGGGGRGRRSRSRSRSVSAAALSLSRLSRARSASRRTGTRDETTIARALETPWAEAIRLLTRLIRQTADAGVQEQLAKVKEVMLNPETMNEIGYGKLSMQEDTAVWFKSTLTRTYGAYSPINRDRRTIASNSPKSRATVHWGNLKHNMARIRRLPGAAGAGGSPLPPPGARPLVVFDTAGVAGGPRATAAAAGAARGAGGGGGGGGAPPSTPVRGGGSLGAGATRVHASDPGPARGGGGGGGAAAGAGAGADAGAAAARGRPVAPQRSRSGSVDSLGLQACFSPLPDHARRQRAAARAALARGGGGPLALAALRCLGSGGASAHQGDAPHTDRKRQEEAAPAEVVERFSTGNMPRAERASSCAAAAAAGAGSPPLRRPSAGRLPQLGLLSRRGSRDSGGGGGGRRRPSRPRLAAAGSRGAEAAEAELGRSSEISLLSREISAISGLSAEEEGGGEGAGAADGAAAAGAGAAEESEAPLIVPPFPSFSPGQMGKVEAYLAEHSFTDWGFDVFEFDAVAEGHSLWFVSMILLHYYNLVGAFALDARKLSRLLVRAERGYCYDPRRPNVYHNHRHGADVALTVFHYCNNPVMAQALDGTHGLALLLAAAFHDYRHPGLNNACLVAARAPLALTYNDQSVLENFHAAQAFALLLRPEHHCLENLGAAALGTFRKVFIELILATDLARGFEYVAKFKALLAAADGGPGGGGGPDFEEPGRRLLLTQMALKCADVGHPAKPWALHARWSRLIAEEFWRQGDAERRRGVPISPLCDRRAGGNFAKSQCDFVDFVVRPCLVPFSKCCKEDRWTALVDANYARWRELEKDAAALAAEGFGAPDAGGLAPPGEPPEPKDVR